jgi:hypothetical protein
MDPRLFVWLRASDDKLAARRRDEAFRDWHRLPDAPPLPDEPPPRKREHFAFVRLLARTAALLRVFGRDG